MFLQTQMISKLHQTWRREQHTHNLHGTPVSEKGHLLKFGLHYGGKYGKQPFQREMVHLINLALAMLLQQTPLTPQSRQLPTKQRSGSLHNITREREEIKPCTHSLPSAARLHHSEELKVVLGVIV